MAFTAESQKQINKRLMKHNGMIHDICKTSLLATIPAGIIDIIVAYAKYNDIEVKAKKENNRQRIIQELLHTEPKYIKNLQLYMKYYILPLEYDRKILSKWHYEILCPKQLFQSLIDITTTFHNQLLNKTNIFAFNPYSTTIGDAFESTIMSSNCNVYKSFMEHYNNTGIHWLLEDNHDIFEQFYKYRQKVLLTYKQEFGGLNLDPKMAFINVTYSHWIRYSFTLDHLIKNTPQHHPDYQILSHVQATYKMIAQQMDCMFKILREMKDSTNN